MNPSLATLIYACGIAGLFYLDRDKTVRTSKALWLPVLYLWVLGSRAVSVWLGASPTGNAAMEGSPIDGAFFQILLIAALIVLVQRGSRVLPFLTANLPILIYISYCLLSVIWSDYPGPAFRKWIKSVEDLVMILVIVTDAQPVAALRRLFSRLAFILLPLSLLFIKYYPNLGRYYGAWDGAQVNTGVTLDKNMLGAVTFVLSLGTLWRFLDLLWSDDPLPDRRRHLWAQGAVLAIGIWLLSLANSATSLVCFVVGAGLMLTTRRQFIRRNPAMVYVLVSLFLITASSVFFLAGEERSPRRWVGRRTSRVRISGRLLSPWRPTRWSERGSKASGWARESRNFTECFLILDSTKRTTGTLRCTSILAGSESV